VAGFYLDHDVAYGIAFLVREEGHDATAAQWIGLQAAEDYEHLLKAAEQGWILIGHNRKDYNLSPAPSPNRAGPGPASRGR